MQVGKSVDAPSTTATVVVVGAGGFEISTSVGVNDIVSVKVGNTATIVPDGVPGTLNGKVVWIGAASGSDSSTTYPVVIGLVGSPAGLRNGAMATTSIQLARSQTSALTVPTSAVHTTNSLHTVTVLADGKTSVVPVQIGIVGAQTTDHIRCECRAGRGARRSARGRTSSNTSSRIANALTGGTGSGLTGGGGFGAPGN